MNINLCIQTLKKKYNFIFIKIKLKAFSLILYFCQIFKLMEFEDDNWNKFSSNLMADKAIKIYLEEREI